MVWMGEYLEEDEDGGNLAPAGRVMEMLSEHTCEGWLEGYVLSGRHGLLNSYEPFIHVIDSMVNQVSLLPVMLKRKELTSRSTANGLRNASRLTGASRWRPSTFC